LPVGFRLSNHWKAPLVKDPPTMQLNRLQEKLPGDIIDWYLKESLQGKIKSVGARHEGLTFVVRLDIAVHTWRYHECEPLTDGRTKPLADWELEILTKSCLSIPAIVPLSLIVAGLASGTSSIPAPTSPPREATAPP
jgi:hypothetical protein